jgi:nitrogen fixation protein NifU and related proteins
VKGEEATGGSPLTREQLIERLVEHSRHPRHHGALSDAEISAAAGNPGCGDVVTVYLTTAPGSDRIEAATFEGTGCTISQGAASLLLQEINRDHPTLAEVRARPLEAHLDLVGREVVGFRERCAAVGFDALQHAVRSLEAERKLMAAGYSAAEARTMRRRVQRD